MPVRGKDAARARGRVQGGRTPDELAEAFADALFWREHWRSWKRAAPSHEPADAQKSGRFATAMARAELGRFYWDRRQEAEFQKKRRKGRH